MRKQMIMCQWFCDKIDAAPDFLDNVWFSDEAQFLPSGHVNSSEVAPPRVMSAKATAWVTIFKHGTIGPFCFEDDKEWSVTINTNIFRCLANFGQHFVDEEGSLETSSGSSRIVPPLHLKRIIGMATASFPWPTDQPQLRSCDPEWLAHSADWNAPYFFISQDTLTLYVAVTQFTYGKLRHCYVKS